MKEDTGITEKNRSNFLEYSVWHKSREALRAGTIIDASCPVLTIAFSEQTVPAA
jgi:hypothetical protein